MSRVTVIIPNYNREAHLPTCLESLQAQTFTDWRAIVGDNASTDRSIEVVRSLGDRRMEVIARPRNIGYIRNTNLLIKEVSQTETEFVAILHSDDWWETDFLRQLVSLLDQTPPALMAVCAINLVFDPGPVHIRRLVAGGPETVILSPPDAVRTLVRTWPVWTPSDVLARADLYRRFPEFEESFPYSTDWLMWLRAASVGAVAVCQRPLANNRRHPNSVTGQAEANALWADEWIRLAACLGREWQSSGPPYPGADRDLQAKNALRFLMKSFELHEHNNRTGALKLTRLAQETAPSRGWRAFARLLGVFIAATTPAVATRLRKHAASMARLLPRTGSPASTTNPAASSTSYLFTVLQQSK